MLTARRMREKMAREAAGLPEPPPPRPDSIPMHEHDRIVLELNKAHAAEMAALKAKLSAGAKPEARKVEAPPAASETATTESAGGRGARPRSR